MEGSKTYKMYTKDDIKRYLNGAMSAIEMYALEKQAIEDSFLADAIDGYHSITLDAAKFDLDWLEKNIGKKEGKVVEMHTTTKQKFPWLKIGIAASFIGVALLFAINYLGKKNDKEVAIHTNENASATISSNAVATNIEKSDTINNSGLLKPISPEAPQKIDQSKLKFVRPEDLENFYNNKGLESATYITPTIDSEREMVEKQKDFTVTKKENMEKEHAKLDAAIVADSMPVSNKDYKVAENKITGDRLVDKERKSEIAAKPAAPSVSSDTTRFLRGEGSYNIGRGNDVVQQNRANGTNTQFSTNATFGATMNTVTLNNVSSANATLRYNVSNKYYFNYKVVDEQGNHIPFTNITIPNDQVMTYSRVDGKFGLFSTDSVLNVNIKAAGFSPLNMQLAASPNYRNIVLKESPTSFGEEIVISGIRDKDVAKRSAKLQSVIEEAEPADGYLNYNTYLSNNINTNEKPTGEVVLSFEVSKTGQPTNIAVAKSLSSNADEEAIRLLTNGPKWKAKKRKASKGRIVIKF
jgi:hypothetical protein